MQTKISLAIIAAVLIAAGLWVWYERTHLPTSTAPLAEEFDWSFDNETPSAPTATTITDVSLTIAGIEVPLGEYEGYCFAVAGSDLSLLQNELSGAVCWTSNKGVEIGVFQQGSALTLMQGDVSGDSTSTLVRTDFVALKKQP